MAHRRQGGLFHVVEAHVVPAIEHCVDLRRQRHRLGPARAAPPTHVLVHARRRELAVRMRRQHQPDRVILHVRRDHHALDQLLPGDDALAGEHRLNLRLVAGRRAVEDCLQLVAVGVTDEQLEEEAVELRLGQRIRAFLLDRVLRGEHEEWLLQRVLRAAGSNRVLLHRFEQRGLRLRRGAVDLVGEDHLPEQRPALKLETAPPGRRVFGDDVRADNVGRHQVRRELDAREFETQRFGQRADEQGLAEAGHAFEQRVSASEEACEHALDDLLLPDDHLADFVAQLLELIPELRDLLLDLDAAARHVSLRLSAARGARAQPPCRSREPDEILKGIRRKGDGAAT